MKMIIGLLMIAASLPAFATGVPGGMTLQGTIVDRSNMPVEGSSVSFTLQVLSPVPSSCVLYTETQTLNMAGSSGNFSLVLGQGTRSGSTFDARSILTTIMSSSQTFAGLQCASGTSYASQIGDGRSVAIAFNDGSGTHTLAQAIDLQSVPFSFNTNTLQGLLPSNFLNLATVATLTQANVETVFSTTNYPRLQTLLAGSSSQYLGVATNGAANIPTVTTAPTSLSAGQMWFDTNAGVLRVFDGTASQVISTSGTLTGDSITKGTIGGTTAIMTSGNLATTGSLSASAVSTSKLVLYDHNGSGPGYTALKSALNVGNTNVTLTFPATAGSVGQILSTDGSGTMSWITPPSGVVTSVTGHAPIVVSGTAAAPVLDVSAASTTAAGIVTLAASGGTTATTVVQATDSRLSDGRTPIGVASGDLAGTYPSPTIAKLQGVAIAAAPTLNGQMLRYDGSVWVPAFVSMFDLRSTVTGTQTFASGCTANQTLTWIAATDNLACTNIAVTDSQVTFANVAAHALHIGATSGTSAPSWRTLVASDLPTGAYDASYFKPGGNAFGAASSVGTSDAFGLNLITGGATRLAITSGGNVGVGVAIPTAKLMLPAGTAAVNTAPLKLTAGINMTTPEAGSIEFDGTNLTFTDSGAVRRTLVTSSTASNFSGAIAATAAGTGLAVTNNATVGGTLGVTGATTVGSTLTVAGASTLSSTLGVTGAATMNSTLAVTGAATLSNALTVAGATTLNGTVALNGDTTLAANKNFTMTAGTGLFTLNSTGTTASPMAVNANALTSGSILSLNSTSTAAAAGNTGLQVSVSGANSTASMTRYGIQSAVSATGATNVNVAAKLSATGGITNYGLLVTSGSVGIGNSTPTATLDVTGHIAATGTAPTIGTCGVGPSVAGNDTRGVVTAGTVATSCAFTFASAYATAPICVVSWVGTAPSAVMGVTATTTGLTVNFSASVSSSKFNYMCMQ